MDIIKYKRGSVWFIDDNYVGAGHIQSKSRPYVVVSNDKCNAYSPVIHVAPITSQVKRDYPQDVIYHEAGGSLSVILCGQITTKDVDSISRCSRYMYTLSDELMEKVDEAIRFQFFYHEETAATKEEPVVEETTTVETVTVNPQIAKFNERMKKTEEMNQKTTVKELDLPRSPAGRIKWTPELKSQFLADAAKYLDEDMMIMYRLQKTSYQNTFYRFKKECAM